MLAGVAEDGGALGGTGVRGFEGERVACSVWELMWVDGGLNEMFVRQFCFELWETASSMGLGEVEFCIDLSARYLCVRKLSLR